MIIQIVAFLLVLGSIVYFLRKNPRETLALILTIVFLLPYAYYLAGSQVYGIVAHTNTDCWGNFDQNIPTQFAPLRNEVPLNSTENSENISSEIMTGLSEYWWSNYSNATIDVPEEDLELSAWYLQQNVSAPWVIFVHGIRGCKSSGSMLLPSGMLSDAGFNVIVFDLRDHGESSIEDDRVSAGQKEWRDVVAVFDWLIETQGADQDRIGLYGTSMGSGTAAITFSLDTRFKSVWLDSGYSDMGKIIQEELEFQGLPTWLAGAGIFAGKIETGEDLVAHSPLDAAKNIGDRHMYISHGNQDKRVQVHHGQEMCNEALEYGNPGHVECWFEDSVLSYDVGKGFENDEHATLMLSHTNEYEQRLVDFFNTSLT
ncbi:MAG: alpha/beta fold hydrolase [Candidatus Poseidoniaceae archaeon]|jgi:pimeloyl-ACP methyl ester carboxylesterase|nr:alpha/beta fold hydrolase [Candidatus Poseidoniaceae archaeon]